MSKERLEILERVSKGEITPIEGEALISKLDIKINHNESYNTTEKSKEMDDYEFSLFNRWKDDDSRDDYDGGIKHFQD